jgi:hypothetical protein
VTPDPVLVALLDALWQVADARLPRGLLGLTVHQRGPAQWRGSWVLEPGGTIMLLLTNAQEVDLAVQPLDQFGNPAPLDGAPTFASSDPAILTVAPDATNPLAAVARTVGPTGVVQVTVSADARIGPEVVTLSGTLDIQVEPGEAVTLGIVTGAPRPKAQ